MNDTKYEAWGMAKSLVETFPDLPEIELQRPDGYRVKVRVIGLSDEEKKKKLYEEILYMYQS